MNEGDVMKMLIGTVLSGQPNGVGTKVPFEISSMISTSIMSYPGASYNTTFIPPPMRNAPNSLVQGMTLLRDVYNKESYVREYRHRCARELLHDTGFDEADIESDEFQTLLKIRYPDIS